eukprot:m.169263 g.169263  ORF g.169263 m.169263 type:complete len:738 (+) comp16667_c2_seq1:114-2327(+)
METVEDPSVSIDSLRLFTRVPWPDKGSVFQSSQGLQNAIRRDISSSVLLSSSAPELPERAKTAPCGNRRSTIQSNELYRPRPSSFVLHANSRYRLNIRPAVKDTLSDSDDDDLETPEEALASSADLRLRSVKLPPLIQLYRAACKAHSCVPVASFEKAIQAGGSVSLRSHGISYKGARAMAEALSDTDVITSVVLVDNAICAKGAAALANLCRENAYLTDLDLSCNQIGTSGIDSVARALKDGCQLRTLGLDDNNFLCMDLTEMCDALKGNATLRALRLARNRIGDVGCSHLARMLVDNIGILELDLSGNRIRSKGAALLAESFAIHRALQAMYLSNNGCGDAGAIAIAKSLEGNGAMKQLRLDHNCIHDQGAEALASMLSKSKLEYLSLAHNPISNEAISKLLTALETGTTSLRILDLDGIALSKENKERMKKLAQQGIGFGSLTATIALTDGPLGGYDVSQLRKAAQEAQDKLSSRRQSTSQRRLSRRRSSMMFVRKPSEPFKEEWAPEDAWKQGFNPDGTPRMDSEWLEARDEHDPSWSAAEAWSKGYHPDGKPREVDRRATRRLSRLSSMGLHEVLEDPVAVSEHDYADFEERASKTFGLLYPSTNDPMEILETYVSHHKLRLVDLFHRIDKDRDGVVTTEEIAQACTELGIPLNAVQMDELIFRLDLDGDGQVDYYEFCEGRRQLKEKHTGFKFRHPDDTPSDDSDTEASRPVSTRHRRRRKASGRSSDEED